MMTHGRNVAVKKQAEPGSGTVLDNFTAKVPSIAGCWRTVKLGDKLLAVKIIDDGKRVDIVASWGSNEKVTKKEILSKIMLEEL